MSEKHRRRRSRRWGHFLLIYSVLFLLLGGAGCYLLYRYAAVYESSLPERIMDDLMAATSEEEWFMYAKTGASLPVTEFEDPGRLLDEYFAAALRGKSFTYRKAAGAYTDRTPVYTVRCGPKSLCTVSLLPVGRHAAGFGREVWQLGEIRSCFTMEDIDTLTVEIDAPEGEGVFLNGAAVSDRWLTGEAVPVPGLTELERRFSRPPALVRYRVAPLFGTVTVTGSDGRALSPLKIGAGAVRYTLLPDARYSVTVTAPENVTVSIGGAALSAGDAVSAELGVLAGLEHYTNGEAVRELTYRYEGLYTLPTVTAAAEDGRELTPLLNERGELRFFQPEDPALKGEMEPVAAEFFRRYIDYSSRAYDGGRYNALLSLILPDTELYAYVRDSVDAMIWASATQVHYDELTFADFYPVSDRCFTCTVRYKADFEAQAWYERYTYDLQNAYALSFVRSGEMWLCAAMEGL